MQFCYSTHVWSYSSSGLNKKCPPRFMWLPAGGAIWGGFRTFWIWSLAGGKYVMGMGFDSLTLLLFCFLLWLKGWPASSCFHASLIVATISHHCWLYPLEPYAKTNPFFPKWLLSWCLSRQQKSHRHMATRVSTEKSLTHGHPSLNSTILVPSGSQLAFLPSSISPAML